MSEKVLRTTIEVPIRPGMQSQLENRLLALANTQEHMFRLSKNRTIMLGDKTLTLMVIWSGAGPPDYLQWKQDLRDFQEAFDDCLDWEKATEQSKLMRVWEVGRGDGSEPDD